MDGLLMSWTRVAGGMGIAAAGVLLASCARFEESGLPGSASSMARNQMMFIRKDPPTFGYYRLGLLAKSYPDIGLFVQKKGTPDFLAETANGSRDYFILYYLQPRQAYACRTRPGQRRSIEFAGPYPVTDKEYRILDGFRSKEIQ